MAVFQVTHLQRYQLQECRNVYYYETITGNPSVSEWQDICDEIRGDYVSEMGAAAFHDSWEFYGITYRQVETAGLPSFLVLPTAGALVGTGAGDPVPAQIALVISAKANSTKPNRVRTYFTGFLETQITGGLFPSSVTDLWEAFFDVQSVLNAAGTNELQRVSVQWNGTHTQVVDYNNVAGAAGKAATVPATQRRRRIGVGI